MQNIIKKVHVAKNMYPILRFGYTYKLISVYFTFVYPNNDDY